MSSIELSIIIPVYNAENCINKALDSIVLNSPCGIEVILIDDGSIDNSINICRQYSQRYGFVELFTFENAGVSVARNRGIEFAKGEKILFLDADDWLVDGWYETVKKHFGSKNPITVFSYNVVYSDRKNYTVTPFESGEVKREDFLACLASTTYMNFCWGKLYSRDFLMKHNIRFPADIKIGEDVKFQMSILKSNPNIVFDNSVLVSYFQSPSSVMHRYDSERFSYVEREYNYRISLMDNLMETDSEKVKRKMYFTLGSILMSYVIQLCKNNSKTKFLEIISEENDKEYFKEIIYNVKFTGKSFYKNILLFFVKHKYWALLFLLFGD